MIALRWPSTHLSKVVFLSSAKDPRLPFAHHDETGIPHPFQGSIVKWMGNHESCMRGPEPPTPYFISTGARNKMSRELDPT